jgi:hypothetical protein
MYIAWKKPLCPNIKLIIVEIILCSLPIFDFLSSISGKIENNIAIKTKSSLFWILKKFIESNETSNPNAKWV